MSLKEIVGIKGYIQTTYMAVYDDKLLLLDAGCRCDVDTILTYITDVLKRSLNQLKTVVVSHMHPDHAGGAELLKQKTGCTIVAAMSYKPWYGGITGKLVHLNDLGLTYFVAHRQGRSVENILYNPVLTADVEVRDGDTVPNFDDWTVLETPGHTDRDLSFWHEPTKQIYTADLILKIKGKFISPYLIALPYIYKNSLRKVQQLQPETILLAHGEKSKIEDEDFDRLVKLAPSKPRKMTFSRGLGIAKTQLRFARKRVDTP